MRYAEVAVNSPLGQRRTFSYSVPPQLPVEVGQAVWVPFGPRTLQGIIFELNPFPQVEEARPIEGIIDPVPVLSPERLKLARWISDHYLSSLFDAARLMLSHGFERRMLTFLELSVSPAPPDSLTSEQKMALDWLEGKGKVRKEGLERALGKRRVGPVLAELERLGLVVKHQELERARIGPRMVPHLRLAVSREEGEGELERLTKRAPRQAQLLRLLLDASGPLPAAEVRKVVGPTSSAVAALVQRGLVEVEEVEVRRDPLSHRRFAPQSPPPLTSDQEMAWQPIGEALQRMARVGGPFPVFLLHGVTGSGKTEIYLRALAQAVSLGRRGLVLVPEIALTPQTIQRFASRFPGRVAVLHSQLSLREQFDEWQRIREGEFDVVIGPRSALFAPQPRLGLIVLDEEHEGTYKEHQASPRYHAREVALKLAELAGAVVILGSATPDVESRFRCQTGSYRLLELPRRVTPRPDSSLPAVELVDMRQELKGGNTSIFSRALGEAMAQTLQARQQAILFLNRRGASTFVQCRDCGFALRCRRCELSLTYHTAEEGLICHQCGLKSRVPQTCPRCGGRRIRFLGLGTQRLEAETARAFPGARLLRWDRDVTRGRYAHEETLSRFLAGEADILIGTQMVAKGLDLPSVTLVGVISADTALHLPDFRAGERTFQLLAQVAGRAGRGAVAGRVIVQTYTPEHYAIQAAARHDYAAFYQKEIEYRRRFRSPPFARLARLLYSHPNEANCQREAARLRHRLQEELDSQGIPDMDILGPTPAFLPRIRGRFRWQIILRGADPSALLARVSLPQGWAVDIDPLNLL
ncbi:MAG: primosomal protein N' [Dehalococcoidia bacterium]